jgi:hypothetical protein
MLSTGSEFGAFLFTANVFAFQQIPTLDLFLDPPTATLHCRCFRAWRALTGVASKKICNNS